MENNNFEETFLAKWISGELTQNQLADFEKHPHYKQYVKISEATQNMSLIEYDIDNALLSLKGKVKTRSKKVKVFTLYKYIGIAAACLVFCAGLYLFTFSNTIYTSSIAEHKNVVLPDGSTVLLNAKATAEVNKFKWKKNREVNLTGEGYFKVKKGSKFKVKTALGVVQVVGTEFTVNVLDNELLIVKCFEGIVKVDVGIKEVVLTQGNALQVYNEKIQQWNFIKEAPSWVLNNETQFNSVPIGYVVTALKRQFDIQILEPENIDEKLIFTGRFSNNNIKNALYTVFSTLGLKYEFVSEKEIRILDPTE